MNTNETERHFGTTDQTGLQNDVPNSEEYHKTGDMKLRYEFNENNTVKKDWTETDNNYVAGNIDLTAGITDLTTADCDFPTGWVPDAKDSDDENSADVMVLPTKTVSHSPTEEILSEVEDLVTVLIQEPHIINQPDSGGCTPLHIACNQGLTQVASALIRKGADLEASTDDGYTPLHCAIMSGMFIIFIIQN